MNQDLREQLSSVEEKVKVLDRAKLRVDTLLQQEKSQGENRVTDLQGDLMIFFCRMYSLSLHFAAYGRAEI